MLMLSVGYGGILERVLGDWFLVFEGCLGGFLGP